MQTRILWIELSKKIAISVGIFLFVVTGSFIFEKLFAISILQWSDMAFIVSIPASICGVTYILTVCNSNNYLGFYVGILMALLLAVQYFFSKTFELSILYIFVFIPIYAWSIHLWKKHLNNKNNSEDSVSYLSKRQRIISIIITLVFSGIVYMITSFWIYKNSYDEDIILKFFPVFQISTSIIANYWLAYKKVDSWIFWIVFSIAGLIFNCIQTNIFSITLFVIFIIVNSFVLFTWIKKVKLNNNAHSK